MNEDAYSLYFEDRAIGQSVPSGYTEKGRFPFLTPYAFEYFDNRAVGQSAMPMSKGKMFNEFDVERERAFTTGWTAPAEPANNTIVPTLIYGGDEAPTTPPIETGGIKVKHVVLVAAALAILLIVVMK